MIPTGGTISRLFSRQLTATTAAFCAVMAGALLADPSEQGATPHLGDTVTKAKETYPRHQEWTEFTPGRPACHINSGAISILITFQGQAATSISYHILGPRARALSPEFIQSHEAEQSKTKWSDDGAFEKGRVMKSEDGLYAYCTPGNYSLILFTKSGFEAYKKESQAEAK